ncbi:MAG: DUF445 domain-containing protein [Sphingopyxis sp.]
MMAPTPHGPNAGGPARHPSAIRVDRAGLSIASGGADVRLLATGLLVVMALLFFGTHPLAHIHPAIPYIRAFAEAAMVGGLADWFAVTALFRHPLGLPIPHTAIIPRNKDRIGTTLAQFIRDNFLVPRLVALRMRRVDAAGLAGRFLNDTTVSHGRLRAGASRMFADMLSSLDQDRLGGMVKSALADNLRKLDIAPLLGQALTAAMADGRHQPLINGFVGWASRTLESNDHLIRDMVHERANALLRLTGIDDAIANSIINGLQKLLADMAENADHPLRLRAEEGLLTLAIDLQNDPTTQQRVARVRDEILENPAVTRWLDGLWEQARGAMLTATRDPQSLLAGRLGDAMRQFGATLMRDDRLKRTVNRFTRRAAVGAIDSYGDAAVRIISDTVRGWDAATVTGRLESAVGRDLQYIRINGTVVGGLVGLLIHCVEGVL